MTNYLIRRGLQMILVVFAATIAIFILLNAVPGGPLSGQDPGTHRAAVVLRASCNERSRLS